MNKKRKLKRDIYYPLLLLNGGTYLVIISSIYNISTNNVYIIILNIILSIILYINK